MTNKNINIFSSPLPQSDSGSAMATHYRKKFFFNCLLFVSLHKLLSQALYLIKCNNVPAYFSTLSRCILLEAYIIGLLSDSLLRLNKCVAGCFFIISQSKIFLLSNVGRIISIIKHYTFNYILYANRSGSFSTSACGFLFSKQPIFIK